METMKQSGLWSSLGTHDSVVVIWWLCISSSGETRNLTLNFKPIHHKMCILRDVTSFTNHVRWATGSCCGTTLGSWCGRTIGMERVTKTPKTWRTIFHLHHRKSCLICQILQRRSSGCSWDCEEVDWLIGFRYPSSCVIPADKGG